MNLCIPLVRMSKWNALPWPGANSRPPCDMRDLKDAFSIPRPGEMCWTGKCIRVAHPGSGLWFSFPCTAHFTAQLLPVAGQEAALGEARGWHFQAGGRAGFAVLHPHPTDSREEAKLVKQVGWSLMQDTPQPTPALAHNRGSSVFPPSSRSKAPVLWWHLCRNGAWVSLCPFLWPFCAGTCC